MLVANPVYEPWDVIEKKYDGYCVFMARCKGDTVLPEGGEVWAYNESLAELNGEVDHFLEDDAGYDLGVITFKTLTHFEYLGPIQVVCLD